MKSVKTKLRNQNVSLTCLDVQNGHEPKTQVIVKKDEKKHSPDKCYYRLIALALNLTSALVLNNSWS